MIYRPTCNTEEITSCWIHCATHRWGNRFGANGVLTSIHRTVILCRGWVLGMVIVPRSRVLSTPTSSLQQDFTWWNIHLRTTPWHLRSNRGILEWIWIYIDGFMTPGDISLLPELLYYWGTFEPDGFWIFDLGPVIIPCTLLRKNGN